MRFQHLFLSTATCFSLGVTSLNADISAQEVWDEWKELLSRYGAEMDFGTQTATNSGFTVTGIKLEALSDDVDFNLAFPSLAFTNQTDGTVKVTTGNTFSGVIEQTPSFGKPAQILLSAVLDNFEAVVSGDPANMVTDYGLERLQLNVDDIQQGDVSFTPQIGMTLNNYTGRNVATDGTERKVEQSMAVQSIVVDVDVQDPSSDGVVRIAATLNEMTGTGMSLVPEGIDMSDTSAMFQSGFTSESDIAYASANYTIETNQDGQAFSVSGSNTGASFGGIFSQASIAFSGSSQNTVIDAKTSQFPFPILLNLAESNMALDMPLAETDDPNAFALSFGLTDFTMNDILWSMFDPTAQLPRDPADIDLDLAGSLKWLVNPLDDKATTTAAIQGEDVIEIHSLNLNKILIDMVGATVTGNGAFTFDNSDKVTFDGMPKPTGQIDLQMLGANGLLDKLATMGLLPAEQAMGVRMMMGLFTRPGEAPDSLTSTIEINGAGQILANGQRIR